MRELSPAQVFSMRSFPRSVASRLPAAALLAAVCVFGSWLAPNSLAPKLSAQTSVRQVKVVTGKGAVEIEVEASDRITPQTRVLSGPDRLVVDFPNSLPGTAMRSQSVNVGQVKDVRFGLFQAKPPVTRLVLDLKSAQSYQIFPYGRTVMIKVIGAPAVPASNAAVQNFPAQPVPVPGLVNANYSAGGQRIQPDPPRIQPDPAPKPLEVLFHDGLLTIKANKATFSEVLYAVQQRTGADIAIPAGAEQERVVADIGPGPVQEVLASLLNGSNFNFMILGSPNDPRKLDKVVLSLRTQRFVPSPSSPSMPQALGEEPPPQAQVRPPEPVGVVPPPPNHGDVPPTSPPEQDAPNN
jgi:AMIN domain